MTEIQTLLKGKKHKKFFKKCLKIQQKKKKENNV